MAEMWDIYDEQEERTGRVMMRGEDVPEGFYHLAVDVWIYNSRGEWLIQKRSHTKAILPDIWAVHGGSALAGESSLEACLRETMEETGLELDLEKVRLVDRLKMGDTIWDVYVGFSDAGVEEMVPQPEEVAELRWVSAEEIKRMRNTGEFFAYPELDDVLGK